MLSLMLPGVAHGKTTLRFSFGSHNGPPYILTVMDGGVKKVTGGLLYELGMELSSRLEVNAVFVEVPRKRMSRWLLSGQVHAYCEWNPQWVEESDELLWSEPVYQSADIYLVRQDFPGSLSDFNDLRGLTVGTQIGYRYSDAFSGLVASGLTSRLDVNTPIQLMDMLARDRVNAIILNDLMVKYYLKFEPYASGIKMMPLADARVDKFCAYSPKAPVSFERFNRVLSGMVEDSTVARILEHSLSTEIRTAESPGTSGQ
nr:transporter substrate-binding domain-containing protein [Hahella sp. CCB-MM4]